MISPNDPEAMLRHTDECRTRGIPFAADPSQQLARMDGADVRRLIDGAAYLFSNEYEKALAEEKTGWTGEEILSRVGVRVTTLGAKGVVIDREGEEGVHVPCVPVENIVDPTGVGDAFRAGLPVGDRVELPLERAAQVGNAIAAHALEAAGPQEYTLGRQAFLDRFGAVYGSSSAADIEPHLSCPVRSGTATPEGRAGRRRGPPACRSVRAADVEAPAALVQSLLPDEVLRLHAAPGGDVGAGGGVVGEDGHDLPDGHLADPLRQHDDRDGALAAERVDDQHRRRALRRGGGGAASPDGGPALARPRNLMGATASLSRRCSSSSGAGGRRHRAARRGTGRRPPNGRPAAAIPARSHG